MMIWILLSQGAAAVLFIVLYIRWYINVPEHKREFLKRTENSDYDIKTDIKHHLEKNKGNIDILIYMLYSAVFSLSMFIFNGTSPVSFLYFPQLIFYSFAITPIFFVNLIFSYTFSTLFFLAGYISGVVLLHKKWHKKRLRK